jgi:N utilization substance protein A
VGRDFVGALLQLNAEKGVSREQLIRTVEEAIQSAYRRSPGDEDIHVRIDAESGKVRVFRARLVVEESRRSRHQLTVAEAQAIQPDAEVGELVETEQLDQEAFGRIHAQTAKQVVLQRLHEAERNVVFDEYASREGELITGTVSRIEPRAIVLDVGKAEAILATTEQSPLEHYRIGQNVKAYVLEVRRSAKGPQIYISRTHKGFLRRLFELEVPEVHAGTVEVKAIAREAGSRSKVAVASRQQGLDPVGATVGQRGARVQAVVAELGGEKIDVIEWSEDASTFVAKALSPAQVIEVRIDEEHRIANVVVPERMLSLAIGREGQNARLAAKLTGWRIDIRSDVSVAEAAKAEAEGLADAKLRGRHCRRHRKRSKPSPSRPRKPHPRSGGNGCAGSAGKAQAPKGSREAISESADGRSDEPGRWPRSPGRASAAVSDSILRRLPHGAAEARSAEDRADTRRSGRDRSQPANCQAVGPTCVTNQSAEPRRSTKDRSSERWKCRSRLNSGPN